MKHDVKLFSNQSRPAATPNLSASCEPEVDWRPEPLCALLDRHLTREGADAGLRDFLKIHTSNRR